MISLVGSSSILLGTTNLATSFPAGWQPGDLAVIVSAFGSTADTPPVPPSGWTLVTSGSGGSGVWGAQTGRRRLSFLIRELQSGDTAPTVSSTGGTGAVHQGRVFIFRKTEGEWNSAGGTGEDLEGSTQVMASVGALGVESNDILILAGATADRDITGFSISSPGASFGAVDNFLAANTVNGNDQSFGSATTPVTGGSSATGITVTASLAKADDGVVGALRIREATAQAASQWSMWNGATEVPLILAGVWDGTSITPATIST